MVFPAAIAHRLFCTAQSKTYAVRISSAHGVQRLSPSMKRNSTKWYVLSTSLRCCNLFLTALWATHECNAMQRPVSFEEGKAMAAEIGAAGYFESSALNLAGLQPLFEFGVAVGMGLTSPRKDDKKCIIA